MISHASLLCNPEIDRTGGTSLIEIPFDGEGAAMVFFGVDAE